MNALKYVLAATSFALLVACGGGGGGSASDSSNTPATAAFTQTYVASATAGEVISYTFNSANNTYSYTVTQSSYGLTGRTGSGTLSRNADGTYSPSESPTSKIYAAQNGLLVGVVKLPLNGVDRAVPILGVSNPAVTGADMAGTYNFISLQCAAKNFGVYTGCNTYYGTVQVVASGASSATYTTCTSNNIAVSMAGCLNTSSGTLTHTSGGIWEMVRAGSTNKNYMVAFKSSNNQKVGFLDFNDLGGYGYGQAVASQQISPSISDIIGDYFAQTTLGTAGLFSINSYATTSSDARTSTGLTITRDSPWTGMAKTSAAGGQGYGILAGTGVYAYRDPTIAAGYFEIGMRK